MGIIKLSNSVEKLLKKWINYFSQFFKCFSKILRDQQAKHMITATNQKEILFSVMQHSDHNMTSHTKKKGTESHKELNSAPGLA